VILRGWIDGEWADGVWVADTWGDPNAVVQIPPAVGHWPGGLLYRTPSRKKHAGIVATEQKINQIREEQHLNPLKDFDPAFDEDAELLAISYWAVGED
jgi:hypothetical protein